MEPKRIKQKGKRPRLRLIRCDSCHKIFFGTVKIVAAPEDVPPFRVDAVAAEEDTFLALSAKPKACENNEHPIRMMTKVFELRPEPPGKILVKGRNPLQFLAIVHDLNREPSWKEEWISNALEGIFREAERRRISSLALPMLGTRYGSLENERFLMLLRNSLEQNPLKNLKHIWLMTPQKGSLRILEIFKTLFLP